MTDIEEVERGAIPTSEGFFKPVRTALIAVEASLALMVDGDGAPVVQYVEGTSGTYGTRHTGVHYSEWSGIDGYNLRVYDDRVFCEVPLQLPKEAPIIFMSTNWEGGKNATTRSDLQSSYPSGEVTWLQWRQWNQVQGGFEIITGPDLDLGGATPPVEVTFGIWRGSESYSRVGMEFYSTHYLGTDYMGIKCHRSGEDAYFANWTLDYRYNSGGIVDVKAIELIPNDDQEPTRIDTKLWGTLEVVGGAAFGDTVVVERTGQADLKIRSSDGGNVGFNLESQGGVYYSFANNSGDLEVEYTATGGSPWTGAFGYDRSEDEFWVNGSLVADDILADGEVWVMKDQYGNYKGFDIDGDGYVRCRVDGVTSWRGRKNAVTGAGELVAPAVVLDPDGETYLRGTSQQVTFGVTSQEWALLRFICAPDCDIHNVDGYGKEATLFLGRGNQSGVHEDIDIYNMNYDGAGQPPSMGIVCMRGGEGSHFGTFDIGYRVGEVHTSAITFTPDDDESPTSVEAAVNGDLVVSGTINGATPAQHAFLADLDLGTPSDGDVPTWDGTEEKWVAAAPSGGGGGSADTVSTVASSGSTEELDLADGSVHHVTLTDDCTFTFAGAPSAGTAGTLTVILKQDATGGRTATWPASVRWNGNVTPILGEDEDDEDVFTFITIDGGVSWYGFHGGFFPG